MGSQDDHRVITPAESASHESTNAAQKRKSSTNETDIGRTVRYRSSQACQSCRTRKVRCDVAINGSRCTNCRLDQVECVVAPPTKGKLDQTRHYTNSNNQATNLTLPRPSSFLTNLRPIETRPDGWTGYDITNTPVTPGAASHVPACVTFDQETDKLRIDQQPVPNDDTGIPTDHASSLTYDALTTPDPGTTASNYYQSPNGGAPLPAFITPLSKRIPSEDLNFLAQKGALTVPEPDLRMEILRGYLFSVHPFMPMLDYRTLIQAILKNLEDEGRVSLLLFQAVMFAGLRSLPLDVIHRLGFQSTKQARKIFFDRVRLLYEFDVEKDSAAILQSLVLMSLWYGTWDDRRHTWHWTGLAYDLARSMGLHREPMTTNMSDNVRRFRRRLWWSLYIRDRMIALGTRRPLRIHDDEFQVATLALEDFDVEPFEEVYQGQPLLPSAEENISTALMCVQLAKLCTCIGHVVSSQYTTLNTRSDIPHTMMVVSKRIEGHNQDLQHCDGELAEWVQSLGTSVRRTSAHSTRDDVHSCSEVHWAILNITYLTVVNVLHRAQALQPLPDDSEAQRSQRLSRVKVKDAARSLTKFSQTMLRNDQVRFLGPVGVTALVAACLSHILDVSSHDEDVRDASTFRLYQSLEVLQSLTEIYASADASISFLTSIIRKAGIAVPPQLVAPTADIPAAGAEGALESSTAWKDPNAVPCGRWNVSSEQNSFDTRWQPNSYRVSGQPQPISDRNGQILNVGNAVQPVTRADTVSPSAVAFATTKSTPMPNHGPINMIKTTPTAEYRVDQYADSTYGGFPNSASDAGFYNWNNDIESLNFTYDFYSNAFGFSENSLQGMQETG